MEDYITALILYCIYLRPARIYYFTNKNTSLGFVAWCFFRCLYLWIQLVNLSLVSDWYQYHIRNGKSCIRYKDRQL